MAIQVQGFLLTGASKPPLIEALALAIERGEIALIDHPALLAELDAFERQVSTTTGHSAYSAPEGLHDDTVIALALALYAAQQGEPRLGFA